MSKRRYLKPDDATRKQARKLAYENGLRPITILALIGHQTKAQHEQLADAYAEGAVV